MHLLWFIILKGLQKSLQPITRYKVVSFWVKLGWNYLFAQIMNIFTKKLLMLLLCTQCASSCWNMFKKIPKTDYEVKVIWLSAKLSQDCPFAPKESILEKWPFLLFQTKISQKHSHNRPWDSWLHNFGLYRPEFEPFSQKEIFWENWLFFICNLSAQLPTLSHYHRDSLIHPMLITAVSKLRLKHHWEPRNVVGYLSPIKYVWTKFELNFHQNVLISRPLFPH